jgi:hypothetical protein
MSPSNQSGLLHHAHQQTVQAGVLAQHHQNQQAAQQQQSFYNHYRTYSGYPMVGLPGGGAGGYQDGLHQPIMNNPPVGGLAGFQSLLSHPQAGSVGSFLPPMNMGGASLPAVGVLPSGTPLLGGHHMHMTAPTGLTNGQPGMSSLTGSFHESENSGGGASEPDHSKQQP